MKPLPAAMIDEVRRRTAAGERVVVIVDDGSLQVVLAEEALRAVQSIEQPLQLDICDRTDDWAADPTLVSQPPTRTDRRARRARERAARRGVWQPL